MNRVAGRAAIVWLLVLLLVAGMAFFTGEYLAKGNDWIIFPGSPHVYNGNNIGCGVVTDRSGILLLDMSDSWNYAQLETLRKSTLHWLGDRDGYISAPAVSHHAEAMAGYDVVNGVYAYGDTVGTAKLTLSGEIQTAALKAMEGYRGTVGVYNYKTGEILCAVTTPTYDPDNVPDISNDATGMYEGVYLNRFVQSSYIPGSIFKTVTAAAALEYLPDADTWSYYCDGAYEFGIDVVTCESAHGEVDLESAFAKSCNCAFAQLSLDIGPEHLNAFVEKTQVTKELSFDGITTSEGNFNVLGEETVEIAWSGVGQHEDQINPCRFMTFMGAIAGGGSAAEPYLVSEIKSGNTTTYRASTQTTGKVLSKSVASQLQTMMRNNVVSKYGAENFPGLTVCAKSGTAEVGGERRPNAMFCGFVADADYPLAFVVAVENGGYGSQTCVPILSEILQKCKSVMDQE